MLKELRFVQGAVAKRDFIPAMTHFCIQNGFVRSYNGTMALCSPIALDFNCNPRAESMVKAIAKCEGAPTLVLLPNNQLHIQDGDYSKFVECIDGEVQHVTPSGPIVNFDGQVLYDAVQTLMPFVGNDASRPWTNGIMLRDQSAFATNNVVIAEYWLGTMSPVVVNIPREALAEIIRIKEPPTHAQMNENTLSLHYPGGRWIMTQLLNTNWPDLRPVLDVPNNATPIDPRLFVGLNKLDGDADSEGRVYIRNGFMRTQNVDVLGPGAAEFRLGNDMVGAYQIKMLSLLEGIATHADFTRYPDASLFFGERLRGAIIGMRM